MALQERMHTIERNGERELEQKLLTPASRFRYCCLFYAKYSAI